MVNTPALARYAAAVTCTKKRINRNFLPLAGVQTAVLPELVAWAVWKMFGMRIDTTFVPAVALLTPPIVTTGATCVEVRSYHGYAIPESGLPDLYTFGTIPKAPRLFIASGKGVPATPTDVLELYTVALMGTPSNCDAVTTISRFVRFCPVVVANWTL